MPRPGRPMRVNEKSKDFKGSMIRLFNSLNRWRILLIFGLLLAAFSSVLSIIAPNILSDLTDTVTVGIKPQVEKLEDITKGIMNNFSEEKLTKKIPAIMISDDISVEDKKTFQDTMSKIPTLEDEKEISKLMLSIPDDIMLLLLDEIEIYGTKISSKDQLKFFDIMSSIDDDTVNDEMLEKMDELPKSIYSLIEAKMDMNEVKRITLILAIIYIISSIFGYIQSFSMATVSNNFAKKLRAGISVKINKLPLKYFDKHETGDVLSRVTNDVDTIGMNMNNSLASLVSSVTMFVGAIIMMFVTNWIMAITAILASLVGFALMFVILGKSQKYFNQRQVELGNLNGFIEEIYSGHNVVKAYNGDKQALREFRELNDKLYECNRKSSFLSGIMQPIMGFVGNFGYVAVCVVGALLTVNNMISFGVIVAFMIYVRLFTNPLSQIAQAMTSLQSTAAASERVFEFLDEEEMTDESKLTKYLDKAKVKGKIDFKHVKFGYDDNRTIIKDFTATVNPGEKIAIVGINGAGKTTLVKLLLRLYDVNNGNILINNQDYKTLNAKSIRQKVGAVFQNIEVYAVSVAENVLLREVKTQEDIDLVNEALKFSGLYDYIYSLKDNINTVVTREFHKLGVVFSGGQTQKLAIARGYAQNYQLFILDEPSSALDPIAEAKVYDNMLELGKDKTMIFISHRLTTTVNADKIYLFENGSILEQGTHQELMDKNGQYKKMFESQAVKYLGGDYNEETFND